MNMKVIIIWGFAIVVLAGIGIFGYFNQDLLLLDDNEYVPTPVPAVEASAKMCRATSDENESIYNFTIKNGVINNIWISYTAKSSDLEGYEAASTIASEIQSGKLNGITSAGLSGTSSDYSLKIQFNPKEYDKVRVEELTNEFSKLSMVIDSINDYDTYKMAISQIGNTYNCE